MTSSTQILNWLTIGFEQPTGSLTENFYFDNRDNEFFSIMAVDYFMLDENMNIDTNVTTNYSKIQEDSLVDRMKRIEDNDQTIISIPRVALEDRRIVMKQFVETLSDPKLIDILDQKVEIQDYRAKFDFYFGDETDEATKKKWEDVKSNFLHQQVDRFLTLNNINIDNATLWIVDSEGTISMDLIEDKKIEVIAIVDKPQNKKPWWKFW